MPRGQVAKKRGAGMAWGQAPRWDLTPIRADGHTTAMSSVADDLRRELRGNTRAANSRVRNSPVRGRVVC